MGHKDSSPMLLETPLMDGGKKNKVVDMSPFFLFEAVGDSEGDFDHQNMMMMKMMVMGRLGDVHNHDDEEEDDDDDAASCSHDVWDYRSHDPFRGTHHDNQHEDDDDDDKVMRRESSKACHDGVGGNVRKGSQRKKDYSRYDDHDHLNDNNDKSTSEVMSTANSHASRNSSSCVESSQGKKMSEKERSRLFWETCLAS